MDAPVVPLPDHLSATGKDGADREAALLIAFEREVVTAGNQSRIGVGHATLSATFPVRSTLATEMHFRPDSTRFQLVNLKRRDRLQLSGLCPLLNDPWGPHVEGHRPAAGHRPRGARDPAGQRLHGDCTAEMQSCARHDIIPP